MSISTEEQRLLDNCKKEVPIELWGPYLSERQWGTVREDYSENGDAWNYFVHDQARSRAYRWGEDGLAGISDYAQNICFAIALWNGNDHILKERLFGLNNSEGNHGEDVKELYYYLDNVPTHYYMKYLYKYPQQTFPYEQLIETNKSLSKQQPEFEILDTDVFNNNQYFDVFIEYAKANSTDIFIKIEIRNKYSKAAPITILPTVWFRNQWQYDTLKQKPQLNFVDEQTIKVSHEKLADYYFYYQNPDKSIPVLFTENETNQEKIFNKPNQTIFVKDAFHDAIVQEKNFNELQNKKAGTKCAPVYQLNIPANSSQTIYFRLTDISTKNPFEKNFEQIFDTRKKEADDFYKNIIPQNLTDDEKLIRRRAFAGLLWNKQYYRYDVEIWLNDGTTDDTPRKHGRNSDWKNIKNADVILMPDKWEYPWYAAWDLAFHCIAMAHIDCNFAKHQLILLTREWYMHASGQVPAYEWNFSDVNPPVQAFAALRVYEIEKQKSGKGDICFLKKIFHKLIIYFTWWVNRKDSTGNNFFEGGFLGLDNIGVFNRSAQLRDEVILAQTDGTSWMAMFALNMMDIAIEIAETDEAYEDSVTKFYEHFILIAQALNSFGFWDDQDKFYYDMLRMAGSSSFSLKLRTIVGLTPLFATSVLNKIQISHLPDFNKRINWFNKYLSANKKYNPVETSVDENNLLLSLTNQERLKAVLNKMLDEKEFLSQGGVRALSKYYENNPYQINIEGEEFEVSYDAGDSTSSMFGGNSNWRGPVWMPINYLIVQALRKLGSYYGDNFTIEFPTGSGNQLNLQQIADELSNRLLSIFEKNDKNERTVHGNYNWFYSQPDNEDLVLFYEYFHGDTLRGIGASHQTGWTALVVDLINK